MIRSSSSRRLDTDDEKLHRRPIEVSHAYEALRDPTSGEVSVDDP